jgi:hypothetical protein
MFGMTTSRRRSLHETAQKTEAHARDGPTRVRCRPGSFYYLKHLPVDVVKIDGEFVSHATQNTADRLVIKAVAEIVRGLGKANRR